MINREDGNLIGLKGNKVLGVSPNELSAPIYLLLELTSRCNLKCIHCGVDAKHTENNPIEREGDLSLDEIKSLVDQCVNLGVANIILSGGEPLLRRDVFDIIAYIKQKGVGCSLSTNGVLLDSTAAERLKQLDIDLVELNLFGPDRESNDQFFGVSGAFDKVIQAVKILLTTQLPLRVNVICSKINLSRLKETLIFLDELGVKEMFLGTLRQAGRALKNKEQLLFSPEEFSEVLLDIDALSRKVLANLDPSVRLHYTGTESVNHCLNQLNFLPFCGAGRLFCSISSNGLVRPCPFFCQDEGFVIGNIRASGLKELWLESSKFAEFRNNEIANCVHCRDLLCMGGCRLESYRKYGNIRNGDDPYCKQQMIDYIKKSLTGEK